MIYRLNFIVILESLIGGSKANKVVSKADFDNVVGGPYYEWVRFDGNGRLGEVRYLRSGSSGLLCLDEG